MSGSTDVQGRFGRAMEAEYEQRAASYRAAGLESDQAHERALEEIKQLGRTVLEELQRRGLFPWPEIGSDEHAEGASVEGSSNAR